MGLTPLIVVADVAASSRWYCELLQLSSGHGGDQFEMLMDENGLVLMLRDPHFDGQPSLSAPSEVRGAGVLLYFTASDVGAVFERATAMGVDLLDSPHQNPLSHALEFSLRDLDGYGLVVAQARS